MQKRNPRRRKRNGVREGVLLTVIFGAIVAAFYFMARSLKLRKEIWFAIVALFIVAGIIDSIISIYLIFFGVPVLFAISRHRDKPDLKLLYIKFAVIAFLLIATIIHNITGGA
jgi:glucan phosphoethanolaminetransferase (alkaline phosphatase superfamily)